MCFWRIHATVCGFVSVSRELRANKGGRESLRPHKATCRRKQTSKGLWKDDRGEWKEPNQNNDLDSQEGLIILQTLYCYRQPIIVLYFTLPLRHASVWALVHVCNMCHMRGCRRSRTSAWGSAASPSCSLTGPTAIWSSASVFLFPKSHNSTWIVTLLLPASLAVIYVCWSQCLIHGVRKGMWAK